MILEQIARDTEIRVTNQKKKVPLGTLKKAAYSMETETGFPFEKALAKEGLSFICEVKKASPSKGIIAEDFPYLDIAREYEAAGADAISCLTEPKYFLGRDSYLKEIAETVKIPVLRKDFVVEEYQIYEAKVLGAGAVLLICALIEPELLKRYIQVCDTLGLSALVEAHDEKEISHAVWAGARVIGVNNRNLKDFSVDVGNSTRASRAGAERKIVRGRKRNQDIRGHRELEETEVDAVLIGETLMKSRDKKKMLSYAENAAGNPRGS